MIFRLRAFSSLARLWTKLSHSSSKMKRDLYRRGPILSLSGLFMTLDASPTFQGVPVASTLLIHQAQAIFASEYPGLEMSVVFRPGTSGHKWAESPMFYPTSHTVTIPIYEKLAQVEEDALGVNGIAKIPVGYLVLLGECSYGCATVQLRKMTLFSSSDELIREFEFK